MASWLSHLPILPILLPLLAGAAMLLLDDSRRGRLALAIASVLAQIGVAGALLAMASGALSLWPEGVAVYRLGAWEAPFGIVLVADRLAAAMLALTAVLALPTLIYSMARWDRMGAHFHPLFQFLLMGLNGAFLTGDLFNLFVFFEVLLAASYGLVLHGSGAPRVKAGLHYIVVNLAASLLFLIGAALVYGAAGTLNMADLALRLPALEEGDRVLCETGIALLVVVFLVKAGSWPLNFWLPTAYSTASAPVAAMFSVMTKVGVYALLRLATLLPESFDPEWLTMAGLATLVFGSVAMLNAQQPQRLAAYSVLVSSGTVMAAFGMGGGEIAGAGLFYLVSSALATGAFFLLAEIIERSQPFGANLLAISRDAFGIDEPSDPDLPDDVVGFAIPAALAFLGLSFISCALLITGLPPLSGFVAKFSLLAAVLHSAPLETLPRSAWALVAGVLGSGLFGIIALSRMGTRIFWNSGIWVVPHLRLIEAGPVALIVLLCIVLTAGAGPVVEYLGTTGKSLYAPQTYIDAVLAASRAPDAVPPLTGAGR